MDPTPAPSTPLSGALSRGDAKAALRLLRDAGVEHARQRQADARAQRDGDRIEGAGDSPAGLDRAVRDALDSGDPLEAIRRFRAAHPRMGLRDAKAAVERLQAQASVASGSAGAESLVLRARAERTPTVQDGDHGGYAVVLLAVLAAGGALAWWLAGP